MSRKVEFLVGSKTIGMESQIFGPDTEVINTFKSIDDAEEKLLEVCKDSDSVIIYQLTPIKIGKIKDEPVINWEEL